MWKESTRLFDTKFIPGLVYFESALKSSSWCSLSKSVAKFLLFVIILHWLTFIFYFLRTYLFPFTYLGSNIL